MSLSTSSPAAGRQSPIFVFGSLRSGTTVFRLMLDSHEAISNPGEFDVLFDHLHENPDRGRWVYDVEALRSDRIFQDMRFDVDSSEDGRQVVRSFVEKLHQSGRDWLALNVHRNLRKIAAIFPEARVIHIVRDPRDVARSSIGMGWAGTTFFGVDHWLETETEWNAVAHLFDRKNVIELRFEDLIMRPQAELERVCNFIGVRYSPKMLSYNTRSTYDSPDPSAVEQWKKKQTPREIALVEFKTKDLLLERKYRLSGYALDPPSLLEKITLLYADKMYKWKFKCRRFGIFNCVMEKLTRHISKTLHSVYLERIHKIARQHVK